MDSFFQDTEWRERHAGYIETKRKRVQLIISPVLFILKITGIMASCPKFWD
jgi:hypothetical protein